MYFLIAFCLCVLARAQEAPIVNITQGVVKGNVLDGYYAFYGIPYAGSASGTNRFKAPTPAPNFPGEFHAINNEVMCAQLSPRGIIGIEDCLILSIYTKNVTTPKPVVVLIQGEEFTTSNFQLYAPNKLVQSDLVVVTLNYRLSIFGFLCLGVAEAPGNAGLKDVVQGLKWIQDNIAWFGGDPNNVFLLGNGAGAAIVDLVTLSPLATGLVHKAMTLSGSGLAPWAVAYDPVGHANAVGEKLSYGGKDNEELAKLLSTTEINLLGTALDITDFPNNTVLFGPCIENANLNPNDTFLADAPINLLRSGNYNDIPYIAGHTNREGTIKAQQAMFNNWLGRMQANFTEFIPVDLRFGESNRTALVNEIREFYFSQKQISMETIEDYLDYHGDTTILVPTTRFVSERALKSKSEVRLFEFAYRGTRNSDWPFHQIPVNGVRHGGILNYLFEFDLKESDAIARDSLIKRITAFAYTSDPNPKNGNTTTWLAIDTTNVNPIPHVLYISGEEVSPGVTIYKEELKMNLNQDEMKFWNEMYSKYYVAPTPVSSGINLAGFAILIVFGQLLLKLF